MVHSARRAYKGKVMITSEVMIKLSKLWAILPASEKANGRYGRRAKQDQGQVAQVLRDGWEPMERGRVTVDDSGALLLIVNGNQRSRGLQDIFHAQQDSPLYGGILKAWADMGRDEAALLKAIKSLPDLDVPMWALAQASDDEVEKLRVRDSAYTVKGTPDKVDRVLVKVQEYAPDDKVNIRQTVSRLFGSQAEGLDMIRCVAGLIFKSGLIDQWRASAHWDSAQPAWVTTSRDPHSAIALIINAKDDGRTKSERRDLAREYFETYVATAKSEVSPMSLAQVDDLALDLAVAGGNRFFAPVLQSVKKAIKSDSRQPIVAAVRLATANAARIMACGAEAAKDAIAKGDWPKAFQLAYADVAVKEATAAAEKEQAAADLIGDAGRNRLAVENNEEADRQTEAQAESDAKKKTQTEAADAEAKKKSKR